MGVCAMVCGGRPEENMWESVLCFHRFVLQVELWPSDLAASAFTHERYLTGLNNGFLSNLFLQSVIERWVSLAVMAHAFKPSTRRQSQADPSKFEASLVLVYCGGLYRGI